MSLLLCRRALARKDECIHRPLCPLLFLPAFVSIVPLKGQDIFYVRVNWILAEMLWPKSEGLLICRFGAAVECKYEYLYYVYVSVLCSLLVSTTVQKCQVYYLFKPSAASFHIQPSEDLSLVIKLSLFIWDLQSVVFNKFQFSFYTYLFV